jgi:hypothetical protein
VLEQAYCQARSAVRVNNTVGSWFATPAGTKQGDPVSPAAFITYLERIMESVQQTEESGILIQGQRINNLRFADDVDLLETNRDGLQLNLEKVNEAAEIMGLQINVSKTKSMVFGRESIEQNLQLGQTEVENVQEFVYLGSLITWDNDCSKEIKNRIGKASGAMTKLRKTWSRKEISLATKVQLLNACVFSVLLYACETWTIKRRDKDAIKAFELRCYRRILKIHWTQKITNSEVKSRLGVEVDIFQRLMLRKLNFFGHVCRMSDDRLIKTVIFGDMEGTNRRGRPRREWLNDIQEWCNMDVYRLYTVAKNREEWAAVVRTSVDTNGH